MFEEMLLVAVMSALLGMIVGLIVRPASEKAMVLGAQGLAMLRGKSKRGRGKPRKKHVAKVKAAKEPTASRRQPKAIPAVLAGPVVVAGSDKPKKKVGRPSKAELARRAALEQEKAMPRTAQVTPLMEKQAATEHAAPAPMVTSELLQEIASYPATESFAGQEDLQDKSSSI